MQAEENFFRDYPGTMKCILALLFGVGMAARALAAADPAQLADGQRLLAEQSLNRNEVDQAVAYAEKAVALAPDSAECQHTLGVVYGGAAQKASVFKRFGLARKCGAAFQRAVALAPANADFHNSLFEFYRQAPAIVGGGSDKAAAEACRMGAILEKKGDRAGARAAYNEALQADPNYAPAAEALKKL